MNYKDLGEFIGNQGMAITMSAILLLLFWHFASEALAQFKKQKDLDRENLKADKELEREEKRAVSSGSFVVPSSLPQVTVPVMSIVILPRVEWTSRQRAWR